MTVAPLTCGEHTRSAYCFNLTKRDHKTGLQPNVFLLSISTYSLGHGLWVDGNSGNSVGYLPWC